MAFLPKEGATTFVHGKILTAAQRKKKSLAQRKAFLEKKIFDRKAWEKSAF